jgi:SAM-dependent methyltransferase
MLAGMRRQTVLALNALNQAFYAAIAPEWSETRRHAWPGFGRVLEVARDRVGRAGRLHVLDVGAGDGRFAAYLSQQRSAAGVEYLGIDASAALLEHARARELGPGFRFQHADFIRQPLPAAGPEGGYHLIGLLGVLHHVPSFACRAELLRQLAGQLAPRAVLAITFWRLDRDVRFASRCLDWARYNAEASQPIDLLDIEPGDTLLRWGAGDAPPRYCHFPDARETEALLEASELDVIDRFKADGKSGELNDYVLCGPRL